MSADADRTLAAIADAIGDSPDDTSGCGKCGRPLNSGGASADFCSESCQAAWLTDRAAPLTPDTGRSPVRELPERAPAVALTFLGPAPAGVVGRPGHAILDAVTAFVSRFSVFPDEHCAPTLALWYAHTHAAGRFYITPRLLIDSAEPGSGKTRVLEVGSLLVANPEMTISATPAAIFRLVSAGPITILFDEVDAIFNAKGDGNEDLRALLNAGYKNGATVARCVGDAKKMQVQRFAVFAPAALAGIAGGMPDTITTRAVVIHMRRRRTDQVVEPFRHRTVARDARPLRDELAAWVASVADEIGDAIPDMPEQVTDRAAEIWEPLLAIADAAGGHWPATARRACLHFVTRTSGDTVSDGVRLLADLRALFALHATDRLSTSQLIAELRANDEAPWGGDGDSRALDPRRLARELGRFGVRPVSFKGDDQTTTKGYVTYGTDRQVGLADAWARYLPPDPTGIGDCGDCGDPAGQTVTDPHPVTDPSVTSTASTPAELP